MGYELSPPAANFRLTVQIGCVWPQPHFPPSNGKGVGEWGKRWGANNTYSYMNRDASTPCSGKTLRALSYQPIGETHQGPKVTTWDMVTREWDWAIRSVTT